MLRAHLKWMMTLGAIMSLTSSQTRSPGCSCQMAPFALLQCTGLPDGGDVIRQSVTSCFPRETYVDVSFYEMGLSDLPDDLLRGYIVTSFRCISCTMREFPPSFMRSFGNLTKLVEIRSSVISSGITNKTTLLPFKDWLDKLWFTHTEISEVESNAFSAFKSLDQLIINHCPKLARIHDSAFANMPKLTWLELCNCNVRHVARHTFWNLPSLMYLHLYGNRISSLKNGTFSQDQQPVLRSLLLFDNPWKCSCDLQWLKDYLKKNPSILSGEDVKCVSPNSGTFSRIDFCNPRLDDYDFAYFDPYAFLRYLITGF